MAGFIELKFELFCMMMPVHLTLAPAIETITQTSFLVTLGSR